MYIDRMRPGSKVAVFKLPAWDGTRPITISGLFFIEEHWEVEPSAYVNEPTTVLVSCETYGAEEYDEGYDVSTDALLAQVCPREYGRRLAEEREWGLAAEDEAAREASVETAGCVHRGRTVWQRKID